MNISDSQLIYILLYKVFIILTGLVSIFFGFKLFTKNIFERAGDVEGGYGKVSFKVVSAAPGTFFSLFGCIIICYGIFKGVEYQSTTISDNTENALPYSKNEESLDSTSDIKDSTSDVKPVILRQQDKRNKTINLPTLQNKALAADSFQRRKKDTTTVLVRMNG